jgi:hypothetical protein
VLGERRPGLGCRPQLHRRGGGGLLDLGSDSTRSLPSAEPSRGGHDRHPLGWQPSRFLTNRAEAERAFQLAEQLGSINAAATELGTTWPSLRKPSPAMASACPPATPKRSASAPSPRPTSAWGAPASPTLDPVFAALNPSALPARERSPGELYQWVRRDEEYATLGAEVVVELNSESRAR